VFNLKASYCPINIPAHPSPPAPRTSCTIKLNPHHNHHQNGPRKQTPARTTRFPPTLLTPSASSKHHHMSCPIVIFLPRCTPRKNSRRHAHSKALSADINNIAKNNTIISSICPSTAHSPKRRQWSSLDLAMYIHTARRSRPHHGLTASFGTSIVLPKLHHNPAPRAPASQSIPSKQSCRHTKQNAQFFRHGNSSCNQIRAPVAGGKFQ